MKVLFHHATSNIDSKSVFVEMSSRELLSPQIRQKQFTAVTAFSKDGFLNTLSSLYTAGLTIKFDKLIISDAQFTNMPKYSFDYKVFKVEKWESNDKIQSFGNNLENLCLLFVKDALRKISKNNNTVTKNHKLLHEHLSKFAHKDIEGNVDTIINDMKQRYGNEFTTEIRMAERCGKSLYDVLIGNFTPHEVLFPDGDITDAELLYERSSLSTVYNDHIRSFLQDVVNRSNRKLRFLEVGAGTGGLTSYVLDAIDGRFEEYVYTDVSKIFLTRAQRKVK